MNPTPVAMWCYTICIYSSQHTRLHGLGVVLLQEARKKWKPIVYASRSMTDTEKRYAQIEKEALSLTWTCDKFQDYLLGRQFYIETNHKLLVPLL